MTGGSARSRAGSVGAWIAAELLRALLLLEAVSRRDRRPPRRTRRARSCDPGATARRRTSTCGPGAHSTALVANAARDGLGYVAACRCSSHLHRRPTTDAPRQPSATCVVDPGSNIVVLDLSLPAASRTRSGGRGGASTRGLQTLVEDVSTIDLRRARRRSGLPRVRCTDDHDRASNAVTARSCSRRVRTNASAPCSPASTSTCSRTRATASGSSTPCVADAERLSGRARRLRRAGALEGAADPVRAALQARDVPREAAALLDRALRAQDDDPLAGALALHREADIAGDGAADAPAQTARGALDGDRRPARIGGAGGAARAGLGRAVAAGGDGGDLRRGRGAGGAGVDVETGATAAGSGVTTGATGGSWRSGGIGRTTPWPPASVTDERGTPSRSW